MGRPDVSFPLGNIAPSARRRLLSAKGASNQRPSRENSTGLQVSSRRVDTVPTSGRVGRQGPADRVNHFQGHGRRGGVWSASLRGIRTSTGLAPTPAETTAESVWLFAHWTGGRCGARGQGRRRRVRDL